MNNGYIIHFGIKRKSGRYPWGSGERPHQSEEKGKSGEETSQNEENPEKKKKFHLSKRQKTAIKIGAGVVGAALLAYGGYKLYNKYFKKTLDRGKLNEKLINIADTLKTKRLEEEKKFISNVNKGARAKDGLTGNCMHCSLATVLHQINPDKYRNVTAKSFFGIDETSGMVKSGRDKLFPIAFFNNVKRKTFSKTISIEDISKHVKPNSFGTVQVHYWTPDKGRGDHILNYKMDGKNLVLLESQTGQILDTLSKRINAWTHMYEVDEIDDFTNAYIKEDMKKDLFSNMVNLNK